MILIMFHLHGFVEWRHEMKDVAKQPMTLISAVNHLSLTQLTYVNLRVL